MHDQFYDPRERERAKQTSRQTDESDMADGRVTAEDLRRQNAFVPGDLAREAIILRWKEMD